MKKTFLLFALMFVGTCFCHAQDAEYKNDTLSYKGVKIYPSKRIQLLYGAKPDKIFVFVFLKREDFPVPALLSKQKMVVTGVKKNRGKYYVLGKLDESISYLGKDILIDIEGAIDQNEIKVE